MFNLSLSDILNYHCLLTVRFHNLSCNFTHFSLSLSPLSLTHTHTLTHTVSQVLFLPQSNSILSCFRDDSIHAWEADTLEYKYHLSIPEGERPHFRAFAVSGDGSLFVAGGR